MQQSDPNTWTNEKLLRKIDQEFHMAGLARRDHDHEDEKRHLALARQYAGILKERK